MQMLNSGIGKDSQESSFNGTLMEVQNDFN